MKSIEDVMALLSEILESHEDELRLGGVVYTNAEKLTNAIEFLSTVQGESK